MSPEEPAKETSSDGDKKLLFDNLIPIREYL